MLDDTVNAQKLDTPPQPALDTNILREYNLYNVSIERLYSYSINNTHARDLNDKTCVIDCANKNNDINKLAHTDSTEIKTLNTEEKKSGYADLAFGFFTEPKQSAVDEWEENETEELAALLDNDCLNDPVVPIDPEEIVANETGQAADGAPVKRRDAPPPTPPPFRRSRLCFHHVNLLCSPAPFFTRSPAARGAGTRRTAPPSPRRTACSTSARRTRAAPCRSS